MTINGHFDSSDRSAGSITYPNGQRNQSAESYYQLARVQTTKDRRKTACGILLSTLPRDAGIVTATMQQL